MSLGRRNLKIWIKRSLLQRQQVAALLGISKPYMSQILNGDRRPSLELLLLIAEQTGVPVGSWAEKVVAELVDAEKVETINRLLAGS